MNKKILFGILVSSICLYYACRGISFPQILKAFQQSKPQWIGIALIIYTAAYIFRSIRWRILLRSIKPIPAHKLFNPLMIGFFANNILPFRMGELIRAHICGQLFNISRTSSLATIVVERIYDIIAFLSIFLSVAFILPFPSQIKKAAYGMGGLCFVLIVTMIGLAEYHEHTQWLLARLPLSHQWKDKLQHSIHHFTHGISGLTSLECILPSLILSFLVWGLEGSTLYFIAHAFPIHLTYPKALYLLFFLALSATIPQAPGSIGTVELLGVMALSLIGIPRNQSLPVILTIHATQFIYICLMGAICLWNEGLTLNSITSGKDLA